ncbi:MAG TPA: hypothetical protein VNO83_21010 [Pseudonocardia sp.]|nr:hypothetical protein [Pseudonocardia sp.]
MTDMLPVLVLVGIGLVLLVLEGLLVRGPARRLGRARSALTAAFGPRVAALQALAARRPRRRR